MPVVESRPPDFERMTVELQGVDHPVTSAYCDLACGGWVRYTFGDWPHLGSVAEQQAGGHARFLPPRLEAAVNWTGAGAYHAARGERSMANAGD
jgi:hypothetical protein